MNPGIIWWNQIGNALSFVGRVADQLQDHRPAILHIPEGLPWPEVFYEAVDRRRVEFSAHRSLRRLRWDGTTQPGDVIMEELCSPMIRAGYWPGETVGAYLAPLEDLMLNEYFVWITGIRHKQDLARWAAFVADYERHCAGRANRAVFLLEYAGADAGRPPLDLIRFRAEGYDCRVFCLELAAALGNSELRDYQAELAQCIGGGNPELCARLLEAGQTLLLEPVDTALELLGGFREAEEARIISAVWRAGITLLFPVLEEFRMGFIREHHGRLMEHMPVTNSGGEEITDPRELEVGALYHIAFRHLRDLSREQGQLLRLCRRVRNQLAHNKPVPYEDVRELLLGCRSC